MAGKIAGVGDEAVVDATGHPWAYWLDLLDDRDGTVLDHKARVAVLEDAGVERGWWRQKLAVGYERQRGLREVGETADAGYQVGVQRTLPIARRELWDLLVTDAGRAAWLGETEPLPLETGATYETSDGTTGEIRSVRAGERVRLTWRPADRDAPTTLQLSLSCPRDDEPKTVLRVHHERLEDGTDREAIRERWTTTLDRLETMVETATDG